MKQTTKENFLSMQTECWYGNWTTAAKIGAENGFNAVKLVETWFNLEDEEKLYQDLQWMVHLMQYIMEEYNKNNNK